MTDLYDFEELIPAKVPPSPLFNNCTDVAEIFKQLPTVLAELRSDREGLEEVDRYMCRNKEVFGRYREFLNKRDETAEECRERDRERTLLVELDRQMESDFNYYIKKHRGDLSYCRTVLYDKLKEKLDRKPHLSMDEIKIDLLL